MGFNIRTKYNVPKWFQYKISIIDNVLLKKAYGDVLEVGCREGRFLMKLKNIERVTSIRGVDISWSAVRKAHELGFNVIMGNGERLPFKNEVFDAVMSANGAPKEMDWELLLSEVYKVLKPGSIFAFDTYNKYPLKTIVVYKIKRFLKTANKPFEGIYGGVENMKDFKKSCLKLGFEIISLYTVLSLPFFPWEILLRGEMFSQIDSHLIGILRKMA